jgi:Na+-transporting methylmalonyl-CoA/oxaloacetate decarboxylase gamma subunit
MPFGPTRRHGSPGRFLDWKVRLFAVGAVLLLIGMARGLDLLIICAFVVLAGAFVLRFFEKEPEPVEEDVANDEDGAPDEPPPDDAPDPSLRRRSTD